jgi:hypothetical protein
MYKDIGSFIFRETTKMMNHPTSLIIKLKGVGSWHLRKRRMEIVMDEVPEIEAKTKEEYEGGMLYSDYLEKHRRATMFRERMPEYEKYLALKAEVNAKRRETQVLLEPNKGENGRFKSS